MVSEEHIEWMNRHAVDMPEKGNVRYIPLPQKQIIFTVDGFQAVILNKSGSILDHHVNQYMHQWAKSEGIPFAGISHRYDFPRQGLRKWRP